MSYEEKYKHVVTGSTFIGSFIAGIIFDEINLLLGLTFGLVLGLWSNQK